MSRRNHKIRRSLDTPPSYWQKFGNWVEKLTDNIFGEILLQAIVSSTFVGIVDMIYSSDGKWSLFFLPLIITVGCIALYFFLLLIVFFSRKNQDMVLEPLAEGRGREEREGCWAKTIPRDAAQASKQRNSRHSIIDHESRRNHIEGRDESCQELPEESLQSLRLQRDPRGVRDKHANQQSEIREAVLHMVNRQHELFRAIMIHRVPLRHRPTKQRH